MSHKPSFDDIVREEEEEEEEAKAQATRAAAGEMEELASDGIGKGKGKAGGDKDGRKALQQRTSNFSPFDRMRFKLDQQFSRPKPVEDGDEDGDEEEEEEDEDAVDEEDEEDGELEVDENVDDEEEEDEEEDAMKASSGNSDDDDDDDDNSATDEISLDGDDVDLDNDVDNSGGRADFFKYYFSKSIEEGLRSTTSTTLSSSSSSSSGGGVGGGVSDEVVPYTKQSLVTYCNEQYDILSASSLGPLEPSETSIESYEDIHNLTKLFRSRSTTEVNPLTAVLQPYLSRYQDVLVDGRDHMNDKTILDSIVLHSCLHVLTARSRVLKHNQRLKEKANLLVMKAAMEQESSNKNKNSNSNNKKDKKDQKRKDRQLAAEESPADDEANADQGYCRPRVLILCPYRGAAYEIVANIIKTFGEDTSITNLDKFDDEFGPPEDDDDDDDNNNNSAKMKLGAKKKKEKKKRDHPDDWKAIFEGKNMDDDFKLGVQVNVGKGKGKGADKGVQLRLFSDFFISDILIASPLGMRLLLEKSMSVNDGAIKSQRAKEQPDADFLSSLEVIYTHQMDVMYMQNFDHIHFVMSLCNRMPIKNRDTDFSRVRSYFLDGNSALHRQLIVSTGFVDPDIKSFFRDFATSISGKVRLKRSWGEGSIVQVTGRVHQVFQRFSCSSFSSLRESRFKYFKDNILDTIIRLNRERTLIVAPTYFDYVKLRSHLLAVDANACFLSEYSENNEISRARTQFFNGEKSIMLYSGRLHFFRRLNIRGAHHIIFYSPPEYPHYYPEIVNFMTESNRSAPSSSSSSSTGGGGRGGGGGGSFADKASAIMLFSKFDVMALERIVGSDRSKHLVTSEKHTFMFK